jgi:hypothetical protein
MMSSMSANISGIIFFSRGLPVASKDTKSSRHTQRRTCSTLFAPVKAKDLIALPPLLFMEAVINIFMNEHLHLHIEQRRRRLATNPRRYEGYIPAVRLSEFMQHFNSKQQTRVGKPKVNVVFVYDAPNLICPVNQAFNGFCEEFLCARTIPWA